MKIEDVNENGVKHESWVCERDIHHNPAHEHEHNIVEGAGEVS